MEKTITVVIMLGAGGAGEFETLVHCSRRRAAIATAQALASFHQIGKIIVAAPESERACWEAHPEFPPLSDSLQWDFDPPGVDFHFGTPLIVGHPHDNSSTYRYTANN